MILVTASSKYFCSHFPPWFSVHSIFTFWKRNLRKKYLKPTTQSSMYYIPCYHKDYYSRMWTNKKDSALTFQNDFGRVDEWVAWHSTFSLLSLCLWAKFDFNQAVLQCWRPDSLTLFLWLAGAIAVLVFFPVYYNVISCLLRFYLFPTDFIP